MNKASIKFNKQLARDVRVKGMTELDGGYIGNFPNWKEIDEIVVPEGIELIDNYTFAWLENLRQVTLAKSVTVILEWAFKYCNDLETVTFKGKTMAEIEARPNYKYFSRYIDGKIRVQV